MYLTKAYEILNEALYLDFAEKMICEWEDVMELFHVIAEFLIQYDDVKKSAEFMVYITKPNGYVTEIGDTNVGTDSSVITNTKLSIFENDHLTYATTQGEDGEMPNELSIFYAGSEYYISHSEWSNVDYSDSTWQMFKSGYSSQTHKHADRDYFVSPLAHNIVAVDRQTYSVTAENTRKVGSYDYEKTKCTIMY